jgi:ABC-type Mn2+/Zn2+ transport system permease subunit
MLAEPFMQRALLAAALLGPVCGLLGVFVTARRMAFFSDTVAHASLTGVAVAFLFSFAEPALPMIGVSLLVAGLMIWLREHTRLLNDTIMALLLSGSVAVGTVLLSRAQGYRGELQRALFGDVLAVGPLELALAAGLLGLVGLAGRWRLNALALASAHEELAAVSGVRVRWLNYGFVLLLTLAVTVSVRLVGILLVGALLVIPAAAARNVARSLRQELLLAGAFGLLAGVAGIAASWTWELPCGPAIVLVCLACFGLTLAAAPAVDRLRGRR